MKQLKRDIQGLLKSLNQLTLKAEKIVKKLEIQGKALSLKKPGGKVSPKGPKKVSDSDMVLAMLKKSKKGVSRAALIEKTGFKSVKVGNILYGLKKAGKIKSVGKGLYVKG